MSMINLTGSRACQTKFQGAVVALGFINLVKSTSTYGMSPNIRDRFSFKKRVI